MAARGIDYARDDLIRDYKLTTAWCFIYPVVSIGQIEVVNERQLDLIIHAFLDRSMAAIDDTGALEVLPA